MWKIPTTLDDKIVGFARSLSCSWVGAVSVNSEPAYEYDNCHNNVAIHSQIYGGKPIIGWYIISGFDTLQAIRHTVWEYNDLIDITPYKDNRSHIFFAKSKIQNKDYSISNCYIQSLDKYLKKETEQMYYIYQLIDPRTNLPFYVGKGKGRRAKTHLWDVPETRNVYKENKINDIRRNGHEPVIVYIAENIIDEQLAYDIESSLIKKYGRKGYDKNGILTNVCPNNQPPTHRGKTYEEIYGPLRAKEQRETRARLQKERGGYGPKKHSTETRKKLSELNTGPGNGMYGKIQTDKTKLLISEKLKQVTGRLNKKSKKYLLTSPTGNTTVLFGGELKDFCIENNLSYSTLKKQTQKKTLPPKYGKTAGWKLEELDKT
jgi:hypothetical protein